MPPLSGRRPRPRGRDPAGHRHLEIRPAVRRRCTRASCSSNHSVFRVTTSPRRRGKITSSDSTIISRCRAIDAEHERVGRQQARARRRTSRGRSVRWSSCMMRSATINGWWYGSDTTPVPSRMRLRALRRRGDEQLRRGDDLVTCRVVLADPGLVVAEPIEVLDGLELATDRPRRIDVQGEQPRRHEGAEPQSLAVDGGRSGHRRTLMRNVTRGWCIAPASSPEVRGTASARSACARGARSGTARRGRSARSW